MIRKKYRRYSGKDGDKPMKMNELLAVMDPDAELYVAITHGDVDEDGYPLYATYTAGAKSDDKRFFDNERAIMEFSVERIRIGLGTVPTVFIWARNP